MGTHDAAGPAVPSLYTPFRDPHRQIRLLQITSEGLSSLSMKIVNLEDAYDDYAALSYQWGTDDDLKAITIDDYQTLVRPNLYNFLDAICGHVRRNWRAEMPLTAEAKNNCGNTEDDETVKLAGNKYFWVDALCINQSSAAERGAQVSVMGQIYQGASIVLVYLGGTEMDPAMQRYLETRPTVVVRVAAAANSGLVEAARNDEMLRPLVESPYWRRLWIIQEFAVARFLVFVSPGFHVPFSGPSGLRGSIGPSRKAWLQYKEATRRASSVIGSRGKYRRSTYQGVKGLVSLMEEHSNAECADPRDRVYGLLALVGRDDHNSTGFELVPDYNISPAQLAEQLVQLLEEDFEGSTKGKDVWYTDWRVDLLYRLRTIVYDRFKWDQEWAKEIPQTISGHIRQAGAA